MKKKTMKEQIVLRCTLDQKRYIKKLAKQEKVPPSTFIRNKIFCDQDAKIHN